MLTSLFGSKKDSKKGPSLASGGPSLAAGGTSPLDYNLRSGSENGSAPRQYRERVVGAEDTQQQVASSAQGNTRSSSPQPAASPQQGGSDERDRDRQFDVLKKHLETALRAGDTDKIIEGYRNLGQHFMQGKTLAEQQAAKQMFEKALEHAGLLNTEPQAPQNAVPPLLAGSTPSKQAPVHQESQALPSSSAEDDIDIEAFMGKGSSRAPVEYPSPGQNTAVPPPPGQNSAVLPPAPGNLAPPAPGYTRRVLELQRALLPGMPSPPDGQAGVGFSFDTNPLGLHTVTSLAPTGSACKSGKMHPQDILRSVNGVLIDGFKIQDVIRLVKGPTGSMVVLVLDSLYHDPPLAQSPQGQTVEFNKEQQMTTPMTPPPLPQAYSGTIYSASTPPKHGQSQPSFSPPQQQTQDRGGAVEQYQQHQVTPTTSLLPQHQEQQHSVTEYMQPARPAPQLQQQQQQQQESVLLSSTQQNSPLQYQHPPQQQPLQVPDSEQVRYIRHDPPKSVDQQPLNQQQPPWQQAPWQGGQPHQPSQSQHHPPLQQHPQTPQQHPPSPQQHPTVSNSWDQKVIPPEPNIPAPQNPVVGAITAPQHAVVGAGTPGRTASPVPQSSNQQLSSTPGGGQQATPASRKRGKRLVLTREPFKGQVVLPEHPVGIGLNLSGSDRGRAPFEVESLMLESPVAKCGQVSPGDVLYSIDGVRVKDKSLPEVIQMLKGPSGTQVTVVFQLRETKASIPTNTMVPGRLPSLQAYEAKIDLIGAEGLPTSNTSDTGLCDPYVCVSLLPETVEAGSTLLLNHKRHSQVNTKTCRKTLNPSWKETHIIRDMHNDSIITDSNRPLPSAHERTPLSGQGFTVMFTVHSEHGGSDDLIGAAFLRNVRMGHAGEHKLSLLNTNGQAVGFSGNVASLHVRLAYGPAQGDMHQAEAAHKAAEMAASRKRRQENGGPLTGANGVKSGSNQPPPNSSLTVLTQASSTPTNQVVRSMSDGDERDGGATSSPGSPPGELAALWVQAYARKTPSVPQRAGEEVKTDVLASFVQPPAQYGDKRPRALDSPNDQLINISNSMLDQVRGEMMAKDKALASLRTEHARLRENFQDLSRMNEHSLESSTAALASLREELKDKNSQIREMQNLLDQSRPMQERLEHQLNSAQQLVRGSLLQHERYEATTEQQAREILQLKRDNDRLERELQSLREEQQESISVDGTKSLNEVIEHERRRFKKALADERARSAEELERQRQEMQQELQHVKRAVQEKSALMESAITGAAEDTQTSQMLKYEVQTLRNALSKERETSENNFRDLRDELIQLKRQAIIDATDPKDTKPQTSIVKAWYSPNATGDSLVDGKVERLEVALAKLNEERDHWRRREGEVRKEMASLLENEMARVRQVTAEKEQAVLELREYEEEVEKLQAQRDNLEDKVAELNRKIAQDKIQFDRMLQRMNTPANNSATGNGAADEMEDLQNKLREKERALVKLQKEHKRLQVIAASRSPAALRNPSGGR